MAMLSKNKGPVVSVAQKKEKYKHSVLSYIILMMLLILALILSLILSICTGITGGNLKSFAEAIINPANASNVGRIMIGMRMPRALVACLTGAAFSLAGSIMQGLTRNPLADAGLLGINAGASFFVALLAVVFPGTHSIMTMLAAFAGAAFSTFLVYGLGGGRHKIDPLRLILAGTAISALLTALAQALSLAFGMAKSLSFWTMGSLSGITWKSLEMTAPVVVIACGAGLLLSGRLSALSLGEDNAIGLGVNVQAVKLIGLLIVLILAGTSVSLVGGISFLGLIIPHVSRYLIGEDYRRVMPVSALLGAIVLVLSDIAARMINAPFDTPVGALVSIIGVLVFLPLTYRKEVKT